MNPEVKILKYNKRDKHEIVAILDKLGWTKDQVEGQIEAINKLSKGSDSVVFTAREGASVIGHISAEFHKWNKLGQIQGLAVNIQSRRKGVASNLVCRVEKWLKGRKARGVYLDTPENNDSGRKFYESIGYSFDYLMTDYYDTGKSGVTYLKLFNNFSKK